MKTTKQLSSLGLDNAFAPMARGSRDRVAWDVYGVVRDRVVAASTSASVHRRTESLAGDRLLTTVQLGGALNVSASTLRTWRAKGTGPAYLRAGGHVRYASADVRAWLARNTEAA